MSSDPALSGRRCVYFYASCLVDLFDPRAGLAAMRVLRHCGVEPIFPDGQSCCGQPAYNAGAQDAARDVARRQAALLSEPWPIVVPSGSCAAMMRIHWPALTGDDSDGHGAHGARIHEWGRFLLDRTPCELEDRGSPIVVVWHGSCSARRELGEGDTQPRLLQRLGNVAVVEPARSDECCGFGGSFAVKFPDISASMGSDKLDALLDSGADLIVSADPGCAIHLDGLRRRRGDATPIMHIAEFIGRRLGLTADFPASPLDGAAA